MSLSKYPAKTTAIVITTAMLTFVSYWKAAAVVLCDLGSSAFYACGIAEQAIGKAAPWFILIIMVLALCVRAIYMESSVMFVRGGVYRVVKEAVGGSLAKISVSALLFDYSLTGPISGVSAGHYLAGFINQFSALYLNGFLTAKGFPAIFISPVVFSTIFALFVTIYFWHKNIIGIEESGEKSLRIVQLSIFTIGILLVWSIITLFVLPVKLPTTIPLPTEESLGWLKDFSWAKGFGFAGILIALGHSLLAMSGEESLAQLYREIASPKVKNLKRAVIIIFAFSFIFTGIMSLFAVMIIPDEVRGTYSDNLFSGLTMYLAGPVTLKIIMQGLIVLVGALLLSGAVNTSIVGSNGVMNRLGEDGIVTSWFRAPHKRYGTTHRFITSITIVQMLIIILCRGDVYLLGEAYAFGVVWCFVSQTLAVLVLRWKDRSPRQYMVPLNIKVGDVYVPIGIAIIFLILFAIALANLFTKTIATKAGIAFTIIVYILLRIFEYLNKRKKAHAESHLEMVNLEFHDVAMAERCGCKHENRILVAARDPNNLTHLKELLEKTDEEKTDILVMTVKQGPLPSNVSIDKLPYEERLLLTNIISVAERYGKHVIPIMVPALDPLYALAKAAFDLEAKEIVLGKSLKTGPETQLERLAIAWGYVAAKEQKKITVRVIWPEHELKYEIG